MPEKRGLPLENPPQEKRADDGYYHCLYCSWFTKSIGAYRTHVSMYHEGEVVESEGIGLGRGESKSERINRQLLALGYVKCQWWTVPCPSVINPLMRRVCQHIAECPRPG